MWIHPVATWDTGSLYNQFEPSWQWLQTPDSEHAEVETEFTSQDQMVQFRLDQEARLIQQRTDL